jgi:hypothetical protein
MPDTDGVIESLSLSPPESPRPGRLCRIPPSPTLRAPPLLRLMAAIVAGAGSDGRAYPSSVAVGRGGGFLGRCSGELVGGDGGP